MTSRISLESIAFSPWTSRVNKFTAYVYIRIVFNTFILLNSFSVFNKIFSLQYETQVYAGLRWYAMLQDILNN